MTSAQKGTGDKLSLTLTLTRPSRGGVNNTGSDEMFQDQAAATSARRKMRSSGNDTPVAENTRQTLNVNV